ncbi:MAG: 2OG-Fe dioxygenase family protein [Crocosphaera sp.]|nr:2OG-Fe dioxygenase family protein [Crocosphaera sp.]
MTIFNAIQSSLSPYQLITNLKIDPLQTLFHDIPKDPYIREGYRYKSLARCRVKGNIIEKQPHTPLFQNKKINPVNGGLVRVYPEIENLNCAKEAILWFTKTFKIDYSYEILVQAQRTKCTVRKAGITTPEGFHRDDIDFLAILCVNQSNILGSETQLKDHQGNIVFKKVLNPGEMLLIDDSKLLHYTSPITLKNPAVNHFGFRDVLIISTAKGFVNQNPSFAKN